jgi:hypothetical protein
VNDQTFRRCQNQLKPRGREPTVLQIAADFLTVTDMGKKKTADILSK